MFKQIKTDTGIFGVLVLRQRQQVTNIFGQRKHESPLKQFLKNTEKNPHRHIISTQLKENFGMPMCKACTGSSTVVLSV